MAHRWPRPIARCASSKTSSRRCRRCKSWFANLGHGNPQIYYNHIQRNDAANYAEVFVQLHEYDTDETPRKLQALRERLERYPGAHIYVKEFHNGPPISAPISVRVIGSDLDVIEQLATRSRTWSRRRRARATSRIR